MTEIAAAEALLAEARATTDARLGEVALRFQRGGHPAGEAIRYALGTVGKRVRPALVLASYRASGGTDPGIGWLATAVEIIHTYSLVHDDLPCMDDDARRRGRPTTHVVFDVPTATRVGFLLVPVAVEVLCQAADAMGLDLVTRQAIARDLLAASGIRGMVGGQWLDLVAEGQRLGEAELRAIHARKTGALIRAACLVGGRAAGADPTRLAGLAAFGEDIGLAFQIADDVLDATATTDQLGKTAGRDASLRKMTYVSFLGVEGARAEARRMAERAVARLDDARVEATALASLAHYIVQRQS
ncbi:MAG: polyprenyl synthetase family protein [Gemmatimonadetes bacterium]|nr:polyprenyl synthetase family protein [Gemmatimonadota bacterium]